MHKEKTQIIDAKSLCKKEMATCIIPLHVITGCDHNSDFNGASKKVVSEYIQSCNEACDLLAS